MSLGGDHRPPAPGGFPRVSGDEPVEYLHEQGFYLFSPRERG